ncbi:hypothetical protein K2Z83_23910 [Oscillochloris sp. ZM17-4]|uniref:hypothetical protein n=1 Tax=Oscillochloris sp. ZM17-4 TaxID=2866714 RepID=UPI001C731A40|nr:hypothetical protein [Oscillochloris sp. ZM17-4]MBX0330707.1 hypothetical protein [Oscillochloris sp. ZM17-4]
MMTTILICNVGNHDIDAPAEYLPERDPEQRGPLPERLRAMHLMGIYEQASKYIDLTLIRKAIRHVEDETGALPDQIILIASNQDDERFKPMDTIVTADLIKRLIIDRYRIDPERIEIRLIRDEQSGHSPADYDGVMRSMERDLADLRSIFPDARYYLEVTGGTPAMTTSLLIAGTKVLGKQAIPIYITKASEMAYSLNTGRQLLRHTVQEVVFSDLSIYSYGSAWRTFEENHDLFRDHQSESLQQLIAALLSYADQRLNLDFQSCRRSLSGKDGAAGGRHRVAISRLYAEVATTDAHWMLREVFWGAKIKFDRGEYADFVGRIFRFQEGCLRYLADDLNVKFTDETGKEFDRAWVEQDASLHKKLLRGEELVLWADRPNLNKVISYLAKKVENTAAQEARKGLTQIEALVDLRNRTQIAHGFTGLSKQVLADYFRLTKDKIKAGEHVDASEADQIIEEMRTIYAQMMAETIGDNPFDAINLLIRTIFSTEATR